jgi:hypothetical protein
MGDRVSTPSLRAVKSLLVSLEFGEKISLKLPKEITRMYEL